MGRCSTVKKAEQTKTLLRENTKNQRKRCAPLCADSFLWARQDRFPMQRPFPSAGGPRFPTHLHPYFFLRPGGAGALRELARRQCRFPIAEGKTNQNAAEQSCFASMDTKVHGRNGLPGVPVPIGAWKGVDSHSLSTLFHRYFFVGWHWRFPMGKSEIRLAVPVPKIEARRKFEFRNPNPELRNSPAGPHSFGLRICAAAAAVRASRADVFMEWQGCCHSGGGKGGPRMSGVWVFSMVWGIVGAAGKDKTYTTYRKRPWARRRASVPSSRWWQVAGLQGWWDGGQRFGEAGALNGGLIRGG
jgi:hypothetical protein